MSDIIESTMSDEEIIKELEEKIAVMEQKPEAYDANELLSCKNILKSLKNPQKWAVKPVDTDTFKKPEYRRDGLFMTEDFLEKCRQFEEYIKGYGYDPETLPRKDYIFLKKEYMENIHGISWYPEEDMFLPEAHVII